jgi:hypothetical protein
MVDCYTVSVTIYRKKYRQKIHTIINIGRKYLPGTTHTNTLSRREDFFVPIRMHTKTEDPDPQPVS